MPRLALDHQRVLLLFAVRPRTRDEITPRLPAEALAAVERLGYVQPLQGDPGYVAQVLELTPEGRAALEASTSAPTTGSEFVDELADAMKKLLQAHEREAAARAKDPMCRFPATLDAAAAVTQASLLEVATVINDRVTDVATSIARRLTQESPT